MTSTVTNISSNINVNFPIAGQSNSSQTFRDNYRYISQAFSAASNELTDLQTNVTLLLNNPQYSSTLSSMVVNGTVTATNFVGDILGVNATFTNITVNNLSAVNTVYDSIAVQNAILTTTSISTVNNALLLENVDSMAVTYNPGYGNVTNYFMQLTSALPLSSVGLPGDRPGLMAVTSQSIYICYGFFDGTTDIWTVTTATHISPWVRGIGNRPV